MMYLKPCPLATLLHGISNLAMQGKPCSVASQSNNNAAFDLGIPNETLSTTYVPLSDRRENS